MSSDYKRQPGSFPEENDNGQLSIFEKPNSIKEKLKKKNKLPSNRIYQLGVEVPVVKRNELGPL